MLLRIGGGNNSFLRQQLRPPWSYLKTLIPDRRSVSTGLEGASRHNQDPRPKPRASNQRWQRQPPVAKEESMVVAATTTTNAISTTGSGGSSNTTTTSSTKEVISTKLGGRVFTAAVPVVDNAPPTPVELAFDATLTAHCQVHVPLETKEGIQTRERVLSRMTALCNEWISSVCQERGHVVSTGQLLTSGSYRLGVHEPGADIDTILVAPAVCHRSDFFGSSNANNNSNLTTTTDNNTNFRDPNSLAERIRRHPDVSNFVPVEGAAIPLLTFDWEGVNIDLLFARLSNSNIVPLHFDVDNDAVLDGADMATEKSLNGPRVTNLIAAMVSGNRERYQNFLIVVRCVRKWAKARGLYSNKMGYWGGININIGVALTVQLYPNACAATLLRKFFLVFSHWRWPQPVLLCQPHDAGYGLSVWSGTNAAHNGAAHRQVAPMITPAYPAMNSTLAVTRQTLQIMQEEFKRAHEIVDQLWRNFQQQQQQPAQPKQKSSSNLDWSKLFEPSDFFIAYPRYLSLCIVGPTESDMQAWAGFVESRLRRLVSDILGRSLPVKKIQLWPKKFAACVADPATSLLTLAQRQNSVTYFIGLLVDRHRMRGDQLNVETPLQNFREYELGRFHPVVPGMDIIFKDFKVKELPTICFADIYAHAGKVEAMKKRRKLRDADPVRLERKKAARLEELKTKMATLQERQQQQKNKNKRSREEEEEEDDDNDDNANELDDSAEPALKAARLEAMESSESPPATEIGKNETAAAEENLLETALDTLRQPDDGDNNGTGGEQGPTAGNAAVQAETELDEDGYESDENVVGYNKDDVRQGAFQQKIMPRMENSNNNNVKIINTRCLPVAEELARALVLLGMPIVPDNEVEVIGAVPPVTSPPVKAENSDTVIKFSLMDNFDIVELDENGHVIDKGDENFTPSNTWIGRKPGFEFKLGERGMGYYRTGEKVVVPSNMAY